MADHPSAPTAGRASRLPPRPTDEWAHDWADRRLCDITDDAALFGEHDDQKGAVVLCYPCPVRIRCLAEALDRREEHGVWGGMTTRDRRALLRRHAAVASWSDLLRAAAAEEMGRAS